MNYFYLDTCILVALITKDKRKKVVIQALNTIMSIEDAVLVTSDFTFVEMAKVLINTFQQSPKTTARQINTITKNSEIEGFEFQVLSTSPSSKYSFDQFWIDVGENMSLYNPGWGDSVHCVIMKNNDIENIVSLDTKDDFEIVRGITLMHPKDIIEAEE